MTAKRLSSIRVEKPWGRTDLGSGFTNADGARVGEIWFETPDDLPLMVKYLLTSERLSIQVHPDDARARAAGHSRGKDEAWVILDAEADSTIALGLNHPVTAEALRAAALDGTIEQLVDWRPVQAGDVIYSPAGTVHAIGAGLTLIEVQQNIDLTYRLYDYGRPRELHLDDGLAVSVADRFVANDHRRGAGPGREILCEGGKFVLERWTFDDARLLALPPGEMGWFVPVTGAGSLDGAAWQAGECWLIEGESQLTLGAGASVLFAYPRADVLPLFKG